MLKIKLTPFGKKHALTYRLEVKEENDKLTSNPTATLGYYNPKSKDLTVDKNLVKSWMAKGAQPTATIRKLLGL